ncbi:phage portal protein [Vagococcus sp. BWB3-3]|uniref:Phage portal protein n=1 Tax=Vagococcus allomyrinae TaxID=2794353 RepID=A0A940PCS6_9ENTE|nr:phage portal protein [Vagococcus allomyrinae]MBP1040373.1 phage portal protein [Vagococcus allomyrinae]
MIVETLFSQTTREKRNSEPTKEAIRPEGGGFNFLMDLFGKSNRKKIREGNADIFDDIYSCVNTLSDDVAKLPIKVYRTKDDKIVRVGKKEHKLAKLLAGRPNEYMNTSDYIKLLMVDCLISGQHFSLIAFDEDGEIEKLLPLSSSTKPVISSDGKLYYQTTLKNKVRTFYPWEIIHIKGFTRDGINGLSPIQVIADRVQANEMANDYNIKMIQEGGTPNGILKVPGVLGKEAKDRVKEEWKKVNGTDAIAVIDSGLDYQQMGLSQQDMQFIESQKYNTQKITAIYKMPLHKVNELGRATYANIEHQALEYVKNTLQPWITRIELEFNTKAFTLEEQEDYYVKFNLDSELRGDSKTRAEVHKIQIESGAKTLDDVRASNEDSPYDEEWSTEPFITLNWTPASNIKVLQNTKAGVYKLVKDDGTLKEGGILEDEDKNGEEGATPSNDND